MRLLVAPADQGGTPGEPVFPVTDDRPAPACTCRLTFAGLNTGSSYRTAVARDVSFTAAELRAAAEHGFLTATDGPGDRSTAQFLAAAVSALEQYGQLWPDGTEVSCCLMDATLISLTQGPGNRAERRAAQRKGKRRG